MGTVHARSGGLARHYHISDDGKTLDGRVVVFILPPGPPDEKNDASARAGPAPLSAEAKASLAQAAAASLTAAAAEGAPFPDYCDHCERQRAQAKGRGPG